MDNKKVFYNGKIYRGLKNEEILYDFIVVKDGKIIEIGRGNGFENYIKEGFEGIDLDNKFILPGFIDSHVHFTQTGIEETYINASKVDSNKELLEEIEKKSISKKEEEWVIASNFNERNLKEKRYPDIAELDNIKGNSPIMIIRADAHACILNTKAFKILNIKEDMVGVNKKNDGKINGLLVAEANNRARVNFSNIITDDMRLKAHQLASKKAVEKGITYINALEGGEGLFSDEDVNSLKNNLENLPIKLKIYQQSLDIDKVVDNGFKQIGGCITLDGSIGSHTAAMKAPYTDDPNSKGILYYDDDTINSFVDEANKIGLQITTHCIGDAAIEQMLNAYEIALKNNPRKDHRHRIEHFSLPSMNQIERAAKLNLVISTQPSFDYYNVSNMYVERLGDERAKRVMPIKSIIDKGLLVAGGSDSPVTIMDPILGIHSAVNLKNDEEYIELKEAIDLFTINGAYASFEEKNRGTLEEKKYADFVVLDKNIFEIQPKEIKDIVVLNTYIEGQKVY